VLGVVAGERRRKVITEQWLAEIEQSIREGHGVGLTAAVKLIAEVRRMQAIEKAARAYRAHLVGRRFAAMQAKYEMQTAFREGYFDGVRDAVACDEGAVLDALLQDGQATAKEPQP
jgi:hypothetical protein